MASSVLTDYQIRQYRPADRDGVLALDSVVWDRDRGGDWFDWKYRQNPYVDHTPLFVVRKDGEVVGARPFMGFEMRTNSETATALQPSDTMVHPDHRRRGIFTRMTEHAIEYYEGTNVDFFFNFPNEASLPGYEKLGWRQIVDKRTYYRVQRPDSLAPEYINSDVARVLGTLIGPLLRGYYNRQGGPEYASSDLTVETTPGVAVDELVELYDRRPPDALHANRTRQFYEWRFASPVWSRSTYVAERDSEPVAAAIVRTRRTNDAVTITQIVDVVPMTGRGAWRGALARLLDAVLGDHKASDLVGISGTVVPRDLLKTYGFRRDDRLPFSLFSGHRCTLVTRPVDGTSWTLNGRALEESGNWRLTYAERDTT
jgi:GNAT superfamily N-acetyltransferase